MSIERPAASDPVGNVAAAHDQETIFYEGSPKLRGEVGLLLTCVAAAAVVLAVPILTHVARAEGAPWWLWAVGIVVALLALVLPTLLVRKNRYRISNYRIDHEEGLLSKRIDTIELWHVDDVRMEQSVIDRMTGVGTIYIHSNDPTSPVLPLRSLPDPRKILDAIKQRIIAVKRQRGVMKFDGGGGHGSDGFDLGHAPHG